MAGRATKRPTVAMILAASVDLASGRKTAKLSASPNSGQKIATTNKKAGTIDQPSPLLSS
ncbi:unannotated protein [freshwater metagenome]|uniref:Unannotated protein n=1 Tax=freshwater metagenome TaxID=449393 RepID=A0A6J6VXA2_9ZZZZ